MMDRSPVAVQWCKRLMAPRRWCPDHSSMLYSRQPSSEKRRRSRRTQATGAEAVGSWPNRVGSKGAESSHYKSRSPTSTVHAYCRRLKGASGKSFRRSTGLYRLSFAMMLGIYASVASASSSHGQYNRLVLMISSRRRWRQCGIEYCFIDERARRFQVSQACLPANWQQTYATTPGEASAC